MECQRIGVTRVVLVRGICVIQQTLYYGTVQPSVHWTTGALLGQSSHGLSIFQKLIVALLQKYAFIKMTLRDLIRNKYLQTTGTGSRTPLNSAKAKGLFWGIIPINSVLGSNLIALIFSPG
jgi:uncharacterized membrane protein